MKTNFEMVKEFVSVMGQPIDVPFEQKLVMFRDSLIHEEVQELFEESTKVSNELAEADMVSKETKAALAKELVDILYVVYGYGATFGIDLDAAFKLVQESNMSKLVDGKPIKDENGKVMKGPNYKKPDLSHLI